MSALDIKLLLDKKVGILDAMRRVAIEPVVDLSVYRELVNLVKETDILLGITIKDERGRQWPEDGDPEDPPF